MFRHQKFHRSDRPWVPQGDFHLETSSFVLAIAESCLHCWFHVTTLQHRLLIWLCVTYRTCLWAVAARHFPTSRLVFVASWWQFDRSSPQCAWRPPVTRWLTAGEVRAAQQWLTHCTWVPLSTARKVATTSENTAPPTDTCHCRRTTSTLTNTSQRWIHEGGRWSEMSRV